MRFPLDDLIPNSNKLLPCPFCGGEPELRRVNTVCEWLYEVRCPDCGCGTDYSELADETAALWNSRNGRTNEPLTLDELKQMDGEPVWLSGKGNAYSDVHYLGEGIVERVQDSFIAYYFGMEQCEFLDVSDYGKTWLAYKRKLEVHI